MSVSEYTPSATSSIGAAWPPQPSNNNRLKGFYPELVETADGLDELERAFWESHESEGRMFDRTTVRAVGSSAMLLDALERGMPIEAAMPVAGEGDLQMMYVGVNGSGRGIEPDYLARHRAVLEESREAVKEPSRHQPEALDIRTVRGSDAVEASMSERFMSLYETFGFSEGEVRELLANPDNTIAYLENEEGEILSTCLAEHGEVRLGHTCLSLYEITEAVTRADMRGRGYYTAVSGTLGRTVISGLVAPRLENGEAAAVYGESNLSSPGVVYSARRNGRVVAADVRPPVGALPASWGILPQNYKVNDGSDPRDYNDFALTYYPVGR